MVESTALEMRHAGNRIGGSNPPLSAKNAINSMRYLAIGTLYAILRAISDAVAS